MFPKGIGFSRVTQDSIINEGQSVVYGLKIEASVDGGDVSLYEGLDASSGRLEGTYKALQNDRKPFGFPVGIYFDRGIYVDIGSNVTAVTIYWLPLRMEGE